MKRTWLAILLLTNLSWASTKTNQVVLEQATESNRMLKRAGAYVGLLGDPFPTILGVNLAYNALDYLRVTAGFGQISASLSTGSGSSLSSTATTVGTGVRVFVPNWNFSPVAGLSFGYVSLSNNGLGTISVGNFESSGAHVYGTLGVDWQTASGFNMGLGYNLSFRSGVGGAPYINLGWFFDII